MRGAGCSPAGGRRGRSLLSSRPPLAAGHGFRPSLSVRPRPSQTPGPQFFGPGGSGAWARCRGARCRAGEPAACLWPGRPSTGRTAEPGSEPAALGFRAPGAGCGVLRYPPQASTRSARSDEVHRDSGELHPVHHRQGPASGCCSHGHGSAEGNVSQHGRFGGARTRCCRAERLAAAPCLPAAGRREAVRRQRPSVRPELIGVAA